MAGVRYGLDAPGIMGGLLALGAAALAAGLALVWIGDGIALFAIGLVALVAGVPLMGLGVVMLVYSMFGKARISQTMMRMVPWRGDEAVLDIGTGAGLLLVAAAKCVPQGRVVGIDVWAAKDLSGNSPEAAFRNAGIEGVADRVEVRTLDARALDYADGSFDVVVSLLCLHNIEPAPDRDAACFEIARVLRPGGMVVIGDYVPVGGYAAAFRRAGLEVSLVRTAFWRALGPMWLVVARRGV